MKSMARSSSKQFWISLGIAAVLISGVAALECDETMKRQHCLDCNVDGYCISCQEGFYVSRSMASDTGGHCVKCSLNCLACTAERCTRCETGYISFPDKCIACEYGCQACETTPTNCTSCITHYKLDIAGECYFRYSVFALLGGAIGTVVLLLIFSFCLGSLKRSSGRRFSRGKDDGESILGDEFKQAPTLISDVTQIGKQSEVDKDLSLVIDSADGIPQVNSPEDSIRVDIFDEQTQQTGGNTDQGKNQKLRHFARNKK